MDIWLIIEIAAIHLFLGAGGWWVWSACHSEDRDPNPGLARHMRDTMLCGECATNLRAHPSMRVFLDTTCSGENRRQAAIILVNLAHKGKGSR